MTFTAKLVPGATPARPFPSPVSAAAAFEAAAAGTPDTDLCLSLESMRGRKYLQIRGVMELGDEDIEVDDGNVQM